MREFKVRVYAELSFRVLNEENAIQAAKLAQKEGYLVWKYEIVKEEVKPQ